MNNLPVLHTGDGVTSVVDPSTGDVVALAEASGRALAHAALRLSQFDRDLFLLRRSLAAELRSRYGVGRATVGGYDLTVAESQSWPLGATQAALNDLLVSGTITEGDAARCLPLKPKPDARQLKALIGRLTVSDPAAAKVLSDACSVSPASVRDIAESSVDVDVAA